MKKKQTELEKAKEKLFVATGVLPARQDVIREKIINGLITTKEGEKTRLATKDELIGRIMDYEELDEREKVFLAIFSASLLQGDF